MGLIAYFKKKFSKDIIVSQDISPYLVFPYNLKGGKLVLNKKAVIPENFTMVIVSGGKILDSFSTGEVMLGAVTLPKSAKRFKLYKPNKNNQPINSFNAKVYFINNATRQNFSFSTYKKIHYKNLTDGRFWVNISFKIDFAVEKPIEFMSNLLNVYSYIKFDEAEKILRDFLSEKITTELERTNYVFATFENNQAELKTMLTEKTEKYLSKIGCRLQNFCYNEIKFSKNSMQKSILSQDIESKNIAINSENLSKWQGLESMPIGYISQAENQEKTKISQQFENAEKTKVSEQNQTSSKPTISWVGLEQSKDKTYVELE